MIPVVCVLLLFEGSGSLVIDAIVAVLLIEPFDALADVFTDNVKLTEPSSASAGAAQEMVPPDPTAGVEQVNVASDAFIDRNVVPDGSASVTVTFCAVSGPLLKMKIE
jgi:hypothetical protein